MTFGRAFAREDDPETRLVYDGVDGGVSAMTRKVHYGDLMPHEFEAALRERPVGYLPMGTLEWHGPQSPLGADFIQARGLLEEAARRFGGIVLPPLWLGPDATSIDEDGRQLVGMDIYSEPSRQLPGSLYWISEGLFIQMVEEILGQARRAGFRCIVAEGHGPSRDTFGRMSKAWRRQFGLHLISAANFPDAWATQNDHAGTNETSILLAVAPDLVDMARLPESAEPASIGIWGDHPRAATASHGRELMERSLALIGKRLDDLGL